MMMIGFVENLVLFAVVQ